MIELLIGLAGGILLFVLTGYLNNRQLCKEAKKLADDIVTDASERSQELLDDTQQECNTYKEEKLEELDNYITPIQAKIESLKAEYTGDSHLREEDHKLVHGRFQKRAQKIESLQHQLDLKDKSFRKKLDFQKQKKEQYSKQLAEKLNISLQDELSKVSNELIEIQKAKTTKTLQLIEEETYTHLEKTARRTVSSAIHRFQRAYCPERGINNINFPSEENLHRTLGKDQEYLPILEKHIGVDLTLFFEKLFLNVSAFDPVRREVTRITVRKMMKEKRLNADRVLQLIQLSKKQLFKKIRSDGNALAKELNLTKLHPEIKNMMGSLRYRYSFSQNQYFHCAEVGWLCGLLSAELGLDIHQGRRAGVLHDIGKAMDHSIDGGHAVIGADFIDKHDEQEAIVHAVRAHHYDEAPNSDLAYLVIAADAISGARPGARRSTADNYYQKMNDLERIGNSFNGVNQTFILSAGREIRIMVDAKKFDDFKALKLSKDIAKKIEEEMVYPGQIRVTVVRETQAIQYAK